ncbi:cytochrome c [Candidatus Nitronereus thalassa]|uniref:Cytochrome c n=1 Tax=Candidatus Nitronereus thalassa TaxID=3020898 RepID=A0ABU3KCC6_9BACT|nr:cytochrome c [Candidatus Nitronereus thalassa]MDT7043922.1 cytochrome c [Candidatus Nitronereus thalassa]
MKKLLGIGAVAVLGLILVVTWLLPGAFSAKGKPPEWEVTMARFARHLATPSQWRDAKNPVEASAENLEEALHHFADHCASCHANDGSGKTEMGPNFYPPVPDLRTEPIQSMSDGELFYVIHFGVRFTGMPAWGSGDPEKDMGSWALVHFIRHLPNITPEEISQMKELNPKTAQERAEQEAMDAFLAGEDFVPPSEHHH